MIHSVIERLIHGPDDVPRYFQNALGLWREIWKELGDDPPIKTLASVVSDRQDRFEAECGSRQIGQEIMAVTAIAQFYSTDLGFEGRAKRARAVRDAFRLSSCSVEVKGDVERVAKDYWLDDR